MLSTIKTSHVSRPVTVSLSGLVSGLMRLDGLFRQRLALRNLDDHLLKDIGLDQDTALREAKRPVWDVPANWRQ